MLIYLKLFYDNLKTYCFHCQEKICGSKNKLNFKAYVYTHQIVNRFDHYAIDDNVSMMIIVLFWYQDHLTCP